MPYWTEGEEHELMDLLQQGATIEALAQHFSRSPEAIRLKIRRLGLAIPEGKKEVSSTPTPQQAALEPLKPTDDLISMEEALKMWLAVIKRLNEPGITGLELKRLRLILMSLKGYAVVQADYYLRLRNLEEEIKEFHEHLVEEFTQERDQAETDEKRAFWQQRIDELERDKPWDQPSDFHVWARRMDLRDRTPVITLPRRLGHRSRRR